MSEAITETVKQRGNVHGEFRDVARVDENLQAVMKDSVNWAKLPPYQKVALRMLQHKVARILSGDNDFDDHWKDIEGYAYITRVRLPGQPQGEPTKEAPKLTNGAD